MRTPRVDDATQALEDLTRSLDSHEVGGARIALVLGSGLGGFADSLAERQVALQEFVWVFVASVSVAPGRYVLPPLRFGPAGSTASPEAREWVGRGSRGAGDVLWCDGTHTSDPAL